MARKINLQRKGMAQGLVPLFRKMDADSNGFLSYAEFRVAIGPDQLNLGFNKEEMDALIAVVDDTGKGAITFTDLARRVVTVDFGKSYDPMLRATERELQAMRAR
jgi:Ca2+-binding EF-hand superfamily protein